MTLWILPNLLDENADPRRAFPPFLYDLIPTLNGLIAESAKEGRRYLSKFPFPEGRSWKELPIEELNEHTKEIKVLIEPLKKGEKWGLISDAGLPILADPGALLVEEAGKEGIYVQALPGPSSIIEALLKSGLPAQSFTFWGYLPREEDKRESQLKTMKKGHLHLFIETPYRNQKLLEALVKSVPHQAKLYIGLGLTSPEEESRTLLLSQWKKEAPLPKKPAIFALYFG